MASCNPSLSDLILLHERYCNPNYAATSLPSEVEALDCWAGISRPSYLKEDIFNELSHLENSYEIDPKCKELSRHGISVYLRLCALPHNKKLANLVRAAVQRREAVKNSPGCDIIEQWTDALSLLLQYGDLRIFLLRFVLELLIMSFLRSSADPFTLCRPIASSLRVFFSVKNWCETWIRFHLACNPHLHRLHYVQPEEEAIEGFNVHRFPYKRLQAEEESWRMVVGSWWLCLWRSPYTPELRPTLYGYVLIPHGLEENEKVGLMISTHGGGMTTGHPIHVPWLATALLDVAKKHHLVIVSWERTMLPNSDGGAPIQDNEDFIRMMLHKNGITEHVESPHKLKVREITVTAESAGVMFAALWLKSYPESIAGAYFRSPLVGNYARQLGKFMDQDIDPKDIIYDFQVILTCLERLGGETPPGKSRPPPEFMYVALCISTLGVFQYFWNESFSIDLLDSTVLPPGCKPVVCLIHGDRDEFVNVGSSKEMHETLERAGFKSSLTIFPELRHNFDLRKSLEDPDMQPVRNFFVSVYGNSVEESNQA